jgi:hypothetical protein
MRGVMLELARCERVNREKPMPFFFIAPIWLVIVIVGIFLFISRSLRHLSSYLILASTFGLITSLVISTAILFLVPLAFAVLGLNSPGVLGVIALSGAYLGGIGIGGIIGIISGILLARKINLRLGWARISS